MKITFPAMRGHIGNRTYYSCMMQLAVIPKMFTFRDWVEFRPEDREQRVLNENRVPQIAKYILDNEDGFLFASITASYKCDVKFKSIGNSETSEHLSWSSIKPILSSMTANIVVPLLLVPSRIIHRLVMRPFPFFFFLMRVRERVQQMFSDLNRFVVSTSKSLNILYDKRDPLSQTTMRIAESVPVFQGMLDKDAVSISIQVIQAVYSFGSVRREFGALPLAKERERRR